MKKYLIIDKNNKKIIYTTQWRNPSQSYYYLLIKNTDKFYDKEWFYHLNNISKDDFLKKIKTELKPHKHIQEIKTLFETHRDPYGILLREKYSLLEINLENEI